MSPDRADRDEKPADEYSASQEEIARHSHDTGGDAPAAGSIAEREAIARGDRPLFDNDENSDPTATEGEPPPVTR